MTPQTLLLNAHKGQPHYSNVSNKVDALSAEARRSKELRDQRDTELQAPLEKSQDESALLESPKRKSGRSQERLASATEEKTERVQQDPIYFSKSKDSPERANQSSIEKLASMRERKKSKVSLDRTDEKKNLDIINELCQNDKLERPRYGSKERLKGGSQGPSKKREDQRDSVRRNVVFMKSKESGEQYVGNLKIEENDVVEPLEQSPDVNQVRYTEENCQEDIIMDIDVKGKAP